MSAETTRPEPGRTQPLAHVEHPRCPFCHEGVRPDEAKQSCLACMAWHHRECWIERDGRCATCGRADEGQASPPVVAAVTLAPTASRQPAPNGRLAGFTRPIDQGPLIVVLGTLIAIPMLLGFLVQAVARALCEDPAITGSGTVEASFATTAMLAAVAVGIFWTVYYVRAGSPAAPQRSPEKT